MSGGTMVFYSLEVAQKVVKAEDMYIYITQIKPYYFYLSDLIWSEDLNLAKFLNRSGKGAAETRPFAPFAREF